MQYEQPVYADHIVKSKQTKFGGLNHNPGAGDGELYEMRNLCSDGYPLMATRQRRRKLGTKLTKPNGITAADKLCWVDGEDFFYGGEAVGEVEDSRKSFANINGYTIVLPDMMEHHIEYDIYGENPESVFAPLTSSYSAGKDYTETVHYQGAEGATVKPHSVRWACDSTDQVLNVTNNMGSTWTSLGFTAGNYIAVTGSEWYRCNAYFKIKTLNNYEMELEPYIESLNRTHWWEDGEEHYAWPVTAATETNEDLSFTIWTPKWLYFKSETSGGETVDAIQIAGESWTDYFHAGQTLHIEGCSIEANNGYYEILGINDADSEMYFPSGTFTLGTDTSYLTKMSVRSPGDLFFRDGTLYGEPAAANTIQAEGVWWQEYFKVGDAVTITGCSVNGNNKTIIIREIEGDELHFYENSFTNCADEERTVTIRREVPQLDGAFVCDNRLWGWKGQTIYASKLGDPFNWNVYDGLETDSWTVDVGGYGDITGGINYQGYPTFFRDTDVYKVYGSVPSNFELIRTAQTGVMPGSGASLAVAGETLFYLNRNGIAAYGGGSPTMISRPFGTERYKNATAGSDGVKYYVSMEDSEENRHLFVYDTMKGLWHEEDDLDVVGFTYFDGNLYYLDADGNIGLTGNLKFYPEGSTEESAFDWWAETTDFTDDSPNKKGISKFQIRMELEDLSREQDAASVTVKLMLDSSGTWIIPEGGVIEEAEKRSYILPIIPQRADHYRLRIEGHGGCRIYSIAKEYYHGSELKSTYGRQ